MLHEFIYTYFQLRIILQHEGRGGMKKSEREVSRERWRERISRQRVQQLKRGEGKGREGMRKERNMVVCDSRFEVCGLRFAV